MTTVEKGIRGRDGGLFSRARRATTVGIVLVITLVAFEAIAVATAMPTAVRELDGLAYYGWPFTAFLVASVVGIVTSGEYCDRRGPRLPVVGGLAIFAVGLLAAGAAPDMAVFVLGRAIQGFGSGAVVVAVYVLVAEVYPESLRPKVFSLTSAAWVMPSLVGPLVAGLLTQHLTWRLVFLGLAPFVVAGLGLLWPTLNRLPGASAAPDSDPDPNRDGPADGPAAGTSGTAGKGAVRRRTLAPIALLAAAGVASLQYSGEHIRPVSLLPLAAGIALLAATLPRLLPAGTLRVRRGLPAAIASRGFFAGAFFGVDTFVPLTLTEIHHYSPAQAGVPLTVGALGWSLGSFLQSRLTTVPRHRLVQVGCTFVGLGAGAMMSIAFAGVPGWVAAPLWTIAGLGMGLSMPAVSVLVLEMSRKDERGQNSAALQICDVLASAVCVGLGGVLLTTLGDGGGATTLAVVLIDLLMAAVALSGAALAGRLRPRESGGVGVGSPKRGIGQVGWSEH